MLPIFHMDNGIIVSYNALKFYDERLYRFQSCNGSIYIISQMFRSVQINCSEKSLFVLHISIYS